MRLVRFGAAGQERPGLVADNGHIYDVSDIVADWSGAVLENLEVLSNLDLSKLPVVGEITADGEMITKGLRLGPCVGNVGKIMGIGLNFSDHAEEAGMDVPTEPILFMKATSSLCGPNDPVIIPRGSEKTDWEVELAVVIGKGGKYINEEKALDHVAGYCLANDVSERSFQMDRLGNWDKGKSADHFTPLGPWLVPAHEFGNPQDKEMWLDVNGQKMQRGNTSKMVFGVAHLIAYLSQFMSLQAGDVIVTGTPPGVGMGMKPPVFLKAGDKIELGVQDLGRQSQNVVAD